MTDLDELLPTAEDYSMELAKYVDLMTKYNSPETPSVHGTPVIRFLSKMLRDYYQNSTHHIENDDLRLSDLGSTRKDASMVAGILAADLLRAQESAELMHRIPQMAFGGWAVADDDFGTRRIFVERCKKVFKTTKWDNDLSDSLYRTLCVDENALGRLRDWVGVYGTSAQVTTMESRVYVAINSYNDSVGDFINEKGRLASLSDFRLYDLLQTLSLAIRCPDPEMSGGDMIPKQDRPAVRRSGQSRAGKIMAWLQRTGCIPARTPVSTKGDMVKIIYREFCKSGTTVELSYFVNILKGWDVSRCNDVITWRPRRGNEDNLG